MAKLNGHAMGEVMDPSLRKTLQQWAHLGRRQWIVKPDWVPPEVPGMQAAQQLIDEHLVGRLWQLATDYSDLLQRVTLRMQQPGWVTPPFACEAEDLVNESGTALSNGTAVQVIGYHVPDRHVAAFPRFGQMLDRAAEWGTVLWTIQVNGKPIRTYYNMKQQRGTLIEPTFMAKPILLRGKDFIQVMATGGVNPVNAFARLPGWLISAAQMTQDGTAVDWNTR